MTNLPVSPHPQPEETDPTRQRIIGAAMKLFSEIGYARTTTRAIAAEAGVNEVTIFRHFGNKKNVLLAGVGYLANASLSASMEDLLTGDYPADVLALGRWLMQDMAANVEFIRLTLCDASEIPEVAEGVAQVTGRNRERVADYFRRQIAAGVVRDDLDPGVLAHAFDSVFSSYVFMQQFSGPEPMLGVAPEAVVRQLADVFVRGTMTATE